jgi:DNA recombination protein RmuC
VKKRVLEAQEQERLIALADIRVAEERLAARDAIITALQADVEARDTSLAQNNEENVQLKEQNAVLQTSLKNEENKTAENLKLLDGAEEKFVAKLSVPVKETLEKLNDKISVVNASATNLGAQTSKLVRALQKPDVRGQWGEMHLERVLEITGMSERCDFFTQQSIGDDDCKQRPDVVVRLPGDKQLAVDAKATLQAFLEMADAADDEARQTKLSEFVVHVRERIKILGSKAYHQSIDGSPEFVVLYLPTEGLFSTALTMDAELLEFADSKRVLLAGPMNLIALLRAVAHGWKQDDVANNAREICTLAEDLYKRLSTFGGHMGELGKQLNKSVEAYDSAVGSLDRSVLPQARKFEKLGAAPTDIRIKQLVPIEKTTRVLQSSEFSLEDVDGEPETGNAVMVPR